jgi:hypothetical protein
VTYNRINWQNLAAGATPLNDTNLDVMDTALDSQNSRITTMEAQGGASFGSGGRELYVATFVSDANSGTSWAQAKATIQAAAAALNGPGTVHVGEASHTGPVDLTLTELKEIAVWNTRRRSRDPTLGMTTRPGQYSRPTPRPAGPLYFAS